MSVKKNDAEKQSVVDNAQKTVNRAHELLSLGAMQAMKAAASITAMLTGLNDSPEEAFEFLTGAIKAAYNDGRARADKPNDDSFDATELTDSAMIGTVVFGLRPSEAIFGAFTIAFVEGHDSE